jgi:ferredoxin
MSRALKEYVRLIGAAAVAVAATQSLWNVSGDLEGDNMMVQLPSTIIVAIETDQVVHGQPAPLSILEAWGCTKAIFANMATGRLIASLG